VDAADAAGELRRLEEEREHAVARAAGVEQAARAATLGVEAAAAAVAEATRVGASASKQHRLETELASAEAKKAEPWPARFAGAQAATRDADRRLREHVSEHLGELVAAVERDGEAAARRVTAALAELLVACGERRRVEASLGQLLVRTGVTVNPGDVSRSRTSEVERAAQALIDSGGEAAVELRRDGVWGRLLGEREPEPEAVEPAPV
jgi:hypothetical protein